MSLSTKQKQIVHAEGRLASARGRGRGERNRRGVWGWEMETVTFRMDG